MVLRQVRSAGPRASSEVSAHNSDELSQATTANAPHPAMGDDVEGRQFATDASRCGYDAGLAEHLRGHGIALHTLAGTGSRPESFAGAMISGGGCAENME